MQSHIRQFVERHFGGNMSIRYLNDTETELRAAIKADESPVRGMQWKKASELPDETGEQLCEVIQKPNDPGSRGATTIYPTYVRYVKGDNCWLNPPEGYRVHRWLCESESHSRPVWPGDVSICQKNIERAIDYLLRHDFQEGGGMIMQLREVERYLKSRTAPATMKRPTEEPMIDMPLTKDWGGPIQSEEPKKAQLSENEQRPVTHLQQNSDNVDMEEPKEGEVQFSKNVQYTVDEWIEFWQEEMKVKDLEIQSLKSEIAKLKAEHREDMIGFAEWMEHEDYIIAPNSINVWRKFGSGSQERFTTSDLLTDYLKSKYA